MADLILLDTTIRDGELSPDFKPKASERLEIAEALDGANVDVIELASTADNAQRRSDSSKIARGLKNATACCIAQLSAQDIDIAKEVLVGARNPRIHLYLDAKRVHAIEKSESEKRAIIDLVSATIKSACKVFPEVQFSPQDATRADRSSLFVLAAAAIDAGAQTINISDTTGTATPGQIKELFTALSESVPESNDIVLSLHAHNHLKRSTQNALAAISHGVRQIEGTINGVGPAGGNTDLIDVVQQLDNNKKAAIYVKLRRLQELANAPRFS